MPFDKSKFLPKFLDEAREHIKGLNEGLLTLEKNQADAENLNSIFRSAHTIKGSSRMMNQIAVSEVAHKLEDAFDSLRQGKISHSRELIDLFFAGVEAIGGMLDQIAAGETIEEAPEEICQKLERAAAGEKPISAKTTTSTKSTPSPRSTEPPPEPIQEKEEPEHPPPKKPKKDTPPRTSPTLRISAEKLDELIKLMGEIVSGHSRSRHRLMKIREIERMAREHLSLMPEEADSLPGKTLKDLRQSGMNLCLELKRFLAAYKEEMNLQGLLTSDLQDRSIKMRMLPLSTLFDPFRTTVRNLARSMGKEIDFIVLGGETELDRKIIEKIGDPLMHMIRNSLDHGIEGSQERKAAGKPETGTLQLSAAYEGGNVLIEVKDDGAGIPLNRIKEKALQKRLISEADIEKISETEVVKLIFVPGMSTSELITDISGRGVGMDVVKRNIEDIKGSIQVLTERGKGSTFQIRLPLTMAMIHVLFIRVARMTFAVPANFIDEIIRVPETDLISVVNKKAVKLRNEIIPVIYLKEIFNLSGDETSLHHESGFQLILIASAGGERLGLIVDAVVNEEDMVIKPLPAHLKKIQWVAGAIISGANEIFNVLHIPKIIESAKEMHRQIEPRPLAQTVERKRILVVDDSVSTREIEKSILESYGYDVSVAANGLEGYEKAKAGAFDLIVSDVEMPQMDGLTLTRRLREEENYRYIPIILVTSLDREEDKKRGIEVGADAYIVKGGFDQSTLLESIQNLVGEPLD